MQAQGYPLKRNKSCDSQENTGSVVFCCNSAVWWPLSRARRFSVKRTIAMTECFILLKCIIKSEDSSLSLGQFGFQFYFFKQTALFYQIFLNHCRTLNFKGFLIYVLYRCQNSASNLSVPQDKGTDMSVRFLCLGCTHGLWNLPYFARSLLYKPKWCTWTVFTGSSEQRWPNLTKGIIIFLIWKHHVKRWRGCWSSYSCMLRLVQYQLYSDIWYIY